MNPRTASIRRGMALAALLGALCTLGFAPFAVSPAPTFSLAGLFLLWQRAATPRQAALIGLAWGLGCFLTGVSWVYVSLSEFGGMAMPLAVLATLLFCLFLALFPALAGGLFARWRSNTMRDIWLFAGLWTLSEWLRGTLLTGFPWLAVGYSQSPPSPLAGWGAVLGVYGVGFSVALIGGLLASLFTAGWKKPLLWLSIILLLGGGALLRQMDWTQPVGAPLKVTLLQGNVPQSLKWDPQNLALSIDTYLRLVREHPADLVVLPETAIPLFFNEVPREVLRSLTQHSPALFGIAIRTTDGGYANGAVLLTPTFSTAGKPGAYTKRHLVPFGEYAPPGFAWFFQLVNIPMSGFTAGATHQAPLSLGEQKIAPNICYEDLFGEELLTALPAATLLVNLSNTAWFGDSLAQPQHLQIAQMRAIETGRTMLRATNTGMTAMIAPNGTVTAVLPPFTAAALTVAAQGYSGLTPYARWGNALILLLAALACLPALRCRAK
jgi:apolipoprotein N-acyltransferase